MYTCKGKNSYAKTSSCRCLASGYYLFLVFSFSVQANTDPVAGANTYLTYCSGCHGLDGFAVYEHAPSFSKGDRLHKNDRELLQSVLNGKNNMPPWQDKLPVTDLRNAITYIRLMHERYKKGESPRQNDTTTIYYRFKPVGEQDMNWKTKEDKK